MQGCSATDESAQVPYESGVGMDGACSRFLKLMMIPVRMQEFQVDLCRDSRRPIGGGINHFLEWLFGGELGTHE